MKNILLHTRLPKNVTLYEALFVTKSTIHHIKTFGRNCYAHFHNDPRPPGLKLQQRAIDGKFVGYTNSIEIFRMWILSKNIVIESPGVKFAPLNLGEITISLKNPSYTKEKFDDAVHNYINLPIKLEFQPSSIKILDKYSRERQKLHKR